MSRIGSPFNDSGRQYGRRGVAKGLEDMVEFCIMVRGTLAMTTLPEKPEHETMQVSTKRGLGGF